MISNKKWQQLLALATTGEKLPSDATEEEKKAYEVLTKTSDLILIAVGSSRFLSKTS